MSRPSLPRNSRAALALSLIAGLSFVTAAPALAQDTAPDVESEVKAEEMTKGEKRLAKMLEGRVAGEPQSCIRHSPTERSTTIDKTAYVYGRGNTIYVQRTSNPKRIDDRDALVTRRFGSALQLCRQDIARTVDPVTGIFSGAVFFEDFIPYTRVKGEAADES